MKGAPFNGMEAPPNPLTIWSPILWLSLAVQSSTVTYALEYIYGVDLHVFLAVSVIVC